MLSGAGSRIFPIFPKFFFIIVIDPLRGAPIIYWTCHHALTSTQVGRCARSGLAGANGTRRPLGVIFGMYNRNCGGGRDSLRLRIIPLRVLNTILFRCQRQFTLIFVQVSRLVKPDFIPCFQRPCEPGRYPVGRKFPWSLGSHGPNKLLRPRLQIAALQPLPLHGVIAKGETSALQLGHMPAPRCPNSSRHSSVFRCACETMADPGQHHAATPSESPAL